MDLEKIVADVCTRLITNVFKWAVAPIKRQFNYLCCFNSNIATLKHEAEALENTAGDLQDRVNSARDNVQVITREVEAWLKESNDMKDLKKTILDEVPNVKSGCLKLGTRFSLSKKAKKTADAMKEHRERGKFDDRDISQPGPSAAMQAVPLGNAFDFKSRKKIEEDIMEILRDGEMNMIGICGMGGLGKTTMAKKIMNKALEKEHLFEEVVLAVVSQPIDKLKIQLEIGGQLGLKDLKDEPSEASRVQKLHARLTAGSKRILLVLDDVWETLKLEDLGIPRGCEGCTILLTSRNHDVLSKMDVKKENIFGMEVLTEEDSWYLFRKTTGTCVDDARLNSIAKEVVKECRGLPIAIITLGAALKDENDKHIWKAAVTQMRKASPNPDFIKEVYNPLKISYDRLQSQEAKFVFLLCCLFGEDVNIPLEHLTYFCMGLNIFKGGISNLDEAMNRMYDLIKMLKSRSLLLDGRNEEHVRMHDVVRDVCTFISKEKGYIDGNDCTWISSFQTAVGERAKFPANLHLLFLKCNYYSKQEEKIIKFDDSSVEEIRDLKVLWIENYSSFTSLPHTTESLRNLGTLVLDSCPKLETLSFVGQLLHLEILICRQCKLITELPQEIKGLNHLKLLDLTGCTNLERIGGGIISSLVGLEELKMLESFKKWEAWDINEERENGNARLRELEALTNLRCLEIGIDNTALAAENMRLSSKLERFEIRIPDMFYPIVFESPLAGSALTDQFFSYSLNKKMRLKWNGKSCLGDWVEKLLRDAECLHLTGDGANNVDYLAKCPNIRGLQLERVRTMKNIGTTIEASEEGNVFPHMELLKLEHLPQLEEILDGPISSNSFENLNVLRLVNLPGLKQMWKSSNTSPVLPKLKKIELHGLPNLTNFELPLQAISSIDIRDCRLLRNLGLLLSAREDYVSQLEYLLIWSCEMMEQVFLWNDNEEEEQRITKIMFPKLKEVKLLNLPKLVALCEGIGGIEFPLLNTLSIVVCPKMKSMVSSEENNCEGSSNADVDGYHSPHLFCQQEKVSFDSLKSLAIQGMNALYCQKVPVWIFDRLEDLTIYGNEGSMIVITLSIALKFVNLRRLCIRECDEIVEVIKDEEEKEAVSGGERTLLFPKLEMLELDNLCKLESFCKGNCYVNCRRVLIRDCYNMKIFNLGSHVSFPFNGLEELTISRYEGNMSLFSSSMARSLVNLKELTIRDCKEMVKVIEDEKEEENVVSSGGAQTTATILFLKLQKLELSRLSKLESFCEWKCDIKMPSLVLVVIYACDGMKTFTLGPLSTPNLETVTINRKEVLESGEKDLNGTLKQQYLIRMEKQKEAAAYREKKRTITEEDEGITKGEIEEKQNWKTTEENEGRKGEIEEEQNS